MKLTEIKDEHVNWAVIRAWHVSIPRKEGVHLITSFMADAVPYYAIYSWEALYLWCLVRSQGFRSRDWITRWDCARLGKNYLTVRDGVKDAAKEFAKYKTVSDLPIEDREPFIREWDALLGFAKEYNPDARLPSTDLPPPPLTVVPPPASEHSAEQTPAPSTPAKPPFRWVRFGLTFGAGIIAGAADKVLDGVLGPGEYDKLIKQIINAISFWG